METATAKIKQPINIISKTVELPQCGACVTRVFGEACWWGCREGHGKGGSRGWWGV